MAPLWLQVWGRQIHNSDVGFCARTFGDVTRHVCGRRAFLTAARERSGVVESSHEFECVVTLDAMSDVTDVQVCSLRRYLQELKL